MIIGSRMDHPNKSLRVVCSSSTLCASGERDSLKETNRRGLFSNEKLSWSDSNEESWPDCAWKEDQGNNNYVPEIRVGCVLPWGAVERSARWQLEKERRSDGEYCQELIPTTTKYHCPNCFLLPVLLFQTSGHRTENKIVQPGFSTTPKWLMNFN